MYKKIQLLLLLLTSIQKEDRGRPSFRKFAAVCLRVVHTSSLAATFMKTCKEFHYKFQKMMMMNELYYFDDDDNRQGRT